MSRFGKLIRNGNSMALLFVGKTSCPICSQTIRSNKEAYCFPAFVNIANDSMDFYNDRCFLFNTIWYSEVRLGISFIVDCSFVGANFATRTNDDPIPIYDRYCMKQVHTIIILKYKQWELF